MGFKKLEAKLKYCLLCYIRDITPLSKKFSGHSSTTEDKIGGENNNNIK